MSAPVSKISDGGISVSGDSAGYVGPGVLAVKDGKVSVEGPGNFLWAYSKPYTFGYKTENGLEIVEDNRTVSVIKDEDINNDTMPHDFVETETVKQWFKKADLGDNITLQYALSNFSDNRTLVKPDKIKEIFGDDVYNYTTTHIANSPVMVYMNNYSEEDFSDAYSYLGSYPQYNDANRAYNAQQFAKAWNGTIIPPNSSASGNRIVGFTASQDSKAPGGSASHGVCPAARSLRAVALSANFTLPTGMNGDFEAVNFGVHPSTGIFVTNDGDEPVKIIMWTEGEGTGTIIHARLIKYVPNS